MTIDDKNMDKFLESIQNVFERKPVKNKNLSILKKMPLNKNESIYVQDFAKNEIVYKRGFKNLLGYNNKEITFNFLLHNIHPGDTEITHRLLRAALLYSLEYPENSRSNILLISYRRKKNDGSYIKVQSQISVFNSDPSGLSRCFLVKMTDISFIDTTDIVNWEFISKGLDQEAFNKIVYSTFERIFTKREKEVIFEIFKGNNNRAIAEALHVSEHTVATHRKNILKKSDTHHVEELRVFCKGIGLIPASY